MGTGRVDDSRRIWRSTLEGEALTVRVVCGEVYTGGGSGEGSNHEAAIRGPSRVRSFPIVDVIIMAQYVRIRFR